MQWCCAAAFWDPLRRANTHKKNSKQSLQQFVYSGWVKWHLAGWISGECNKHSLQQHLVFLCPVNRNSFTLQSQMERSSSLWYGGIFWPSPSTMHGEGTASRPNLCLLSVLSPWVASSSACPFWKNQDWVFINACIFTPCLDLRWGLTLS